MGKRGWRLLCSVATLGSLTLGAGCEGPSHIDPTQNPPDPGTFPVPMPMDPGAFLDPRVMTTAPVSLDDPPPPITGGTLFVTGAGDTAIVSDPDRDRILVVDLVALDVTGIATLPAGAQPFRAIEDADGHIHVVLRGTGEVFSFAPANVAHGERHHVCAMPRGIAYDGEQDALVVACRSGALVTMATDGSVRSTVQVEPDLRDVVIQGGEIFVSVFRTAELLRIDRSGTILQTSRPETSVGFGRGGFEDGPRGGLDGGFSPGVAWRTIAIPSASTGIPSGAHTIAAVHQRASDTPVEPAPGGYGGGFSMCGPSSIVQSAITLYRADGSHTSGLTITGATMPVDLAISPDGQHATVVAAANESGLQAIQTFDLSMVAAGADALCPTGTEPTDAQGNPVMLTNPIAVAYDGASRLVIQQREPAQLFIPALNRAIPLHNLDGSAAVSRFDTGHAVFHGNSGANIACGSCHPEGGDDGRVWNFDGIGPRRTPAMHGELSGTEPFHWDGDMTDLHVLVHQVFTSRMSGPELSGRQVDALSNFLDFGITAPAHEAGIDTDAVTRGQDLFYGQAECGTCHEGALMTNNRSMDVGTGGTFQVPSLIGVAYRTPLMHNGACPTLRARLTDATCSGGDHHGHTSDLTPGQVNDLVAFLTTL